MIDETWAILVPADASSLITRAAEDLADYFVTSMKIKLSVTTEAGSSRIEFATAADRPGLVPDGTAARGYTLVITPESIVLCGTTPRGAAQAGYHLEELINLRGGPFLTPAHQTREPLFEPRMTHSGWDLDTFPDPYLNQVAHAGMDSIVVFATGPDRSPGPSRRREDDRWCDFNDLVDRCANYGLDVYLYAKLHHERPVHPDDPEAETFFARTYGALFESCPRARGIVLVGESVEFPSKDPNTSGRLWADPVPDGLPDDRPLPGWWPCTDYPQWVEKVRDACRRHNPDAEIIFWTYNWGWAPEAERVRLVRDLPQDVTLQATFEMFEPVEHDGIRSVCADYTASFVGPGRYFSSEAAAARGRGLALNSMTNTGGLTWDLGVVPYQPIPYQWSARHTAVLAARREWGLGGLMENHHYGWWPSFVSELAKWAYWTESPEPEEVLAAIARRDYGAGADDALAAWRLWSIAASDHVPSNGDQYGPLRIGPAYPLVFRAQPVLPASGDAMFGARIVTYPYHPDEASAVPSTAIARRIPAEIDALRRMIARWDAGQGLIEQASAAAPVHKQPAADELVNLGRFIGCCLRTTINTKQWWVLNARLKVTPDADAAEAILNQLTTVGEAEHANAEAAIPLVEADSRLGWEPSMGYLGDAEHIKWKLAHLRHALDHELPDFRLTVRI